MQPNSIRYLVDSLDQVVTKFPDLRDRQANEGRSVHDLGDSNRGLTRYLCTGFEGDEEADMPPPVSAPAVTAEAACCCRSMRVIQCSKSFCSLVLLCSNSICRCSISCFNSRSLAKASLYATFSYIVYKIGYETADLNTADSHVCLKCTTAADIHAWHVAVEFLPSCPGCYVSPGHSTQL